MPQNSECGRVLLKLSGSQFAGSQEHGIDIEFLDWLAQEVIKVRDQGVQIVIVVGGGNVVRGAEFSQNGMDRTTADYMGMLATMINGLALTNMLEKYQQPARLMTRLRAKSVAEPYIHRRAFRHLEKNRIVIIGGGTGNPYVTTDTAAVLAAVELDCEAVLKATNVDGIYNKDPNQHQDAKLLKDVSYEQALSDDGIRAMDKTALALAAENSIPLHVFNLHAENSILGVLRGQAVGTTVG